MPPGSRNNEDGHRRSLPHQVLPIIAHSLLETHGGGHQHIQVDLPASL
jgi:hypothetical protein